MAQPKTSRISKIVQTIARWKHLWTRDLAEDRRQALIHRSMPPRRRDPNPRMDDLRIRPGQELEDEIYWSVLGKETLLINSDPGVGKTHTILKVLDDMVAKKLILGRLHFTVQKSTQPEDFFANSMAVHTRKGEPRIVLQPAPFLDVHRRTNNNPDATIHEVLENRDASKTIVIFIDEVTRGNAIMIDALLEMIENGTFLIEGKKYALPEMMFIFAANPPGMDGSCSTLSPAFRSRLYQMISLFTADLDVLTETYVPLALRKQAKQLKCPEALIPGRDLIRRAVVIWQTLSGLPLDRACYANTSDATLQLLKELAIADEDVRADLELIGRETLRGPDARKPMKWLARALRAAACRWQRGDKTARVTDDDLLAVCVPVLAAGFRLRFNEDQASRLLELHRATYRVVSRMLSNPAFQDCILHSEGPLSVAHRMIPA